MEGFRPTLFGYNLMGGNSLGKENRKAQNHGLQPKVLHLCILGV
jgi:hypothetical protein